MPVSYKRHGSGPKSSLAGSRGAANLSGELCLPRVQFKIIVQKGLRLEEKWIQCRSPKFANMREGSSSSIRCHSEMINLKICFRFEALRNEIFIRKFTSDQ
ncbi:hypothetical protein DC522_20690 [Microvirga sp. KLBC 81]|nr:hypothetical protein DC522_20690 [Microvirga sp. KLBC 81]